ncbi:MAG: polysaccharide biosynthesis tyrosine autokinase [Verrucomicrobiota bacterium]|jgi:capsular exopolysaccharide synthesis family protein
MDVATSNEVPELKLHFLDYWRVIRLRRSLILMVFLLCAVTSILLTFWLPKQYSSTVRIEVQKDTPEIDVTQGGGHLGSVGSDPYFLATQFKIIQSWSILTNVIVSLHLDEKLAAQVGDPPWSLDKTFGALAGKVTVEQTRMTSLVEISVRNSDAKMAADIANAIVDAYRDSRLEKWKSDRYGGISALQQELSLKETKLGAMVTNLNELRATLQISDLDEESPVTSATIETEQLREYQHEETMAQADYLEYSNILAGIAAIPTNDLGDAINTAFAHQADTELGALAMRLNTAKDRLASINNDYGPKHTEYQTAQTQYSQARRDYETKLTGIITGLKERVEIDKQNMEVMQRLKSDLETRRNELARKNQPYFTLKRDIEDLRRNNEELNRMIQKEVAEVGQPLNTVIVRDPARPVLRPVSPKTIFIIPFGVLVGLIVGVSLAFFIEYLDTSVKTIDDVERALQAPVLGVIPQNIGNIMEEGPETPHAEAYRVLRTNILFSRKNESWNTISVLSGGAGEGKTTTLFNLAVIFAQNGQRVLVVDSDLRRPAIHKMLHLPNNIGLTDFLLKQRTLDEIIQKTKLATLDFIPSGKLPSSSMSILGSAQMKETIQELKRRYDFIFFDSPPLLGVSDASILASEMDMILQVIQYRRYPQPMTLRAKQMILKVGGNLVGLVLNNINMSQDENYYYYSGYYEYGSQQKDRTVVQLSDAAKEAKIDIKQKY